ncbi:MAG: ATPase [Paenibacillaceae bacterium]
MLKLGQKVIIIGDSFEQHLPIGSHGYIIAYDRNADNAFDYVVRIPSANKHIYVPSADIELEDILLALEADRVEKEALIDFALATYNEELFRWVMNGEEEEIPLPEQSKALSGDEFVRQINLKAWI